MWLEGSGLLHPGTPCIGLWWRETHQACSKRKARRLNWNQKSVLNLARSSQLALSSRTILNRISPCLGAWGFPPPGQRSNWGQVSLVFAVADQAILPGTARLPSPCPQAGKHFDRGLQQEGSDELYGQSFDYDDPSVNGNLFNLYSELGIIEHEMREDVYDNVVDSTIVVAHLFPVAVC